MDKIQTCVSCTKWEIPYDVIITICKHCGFTVSNWNIWLNKLNKENGLHQNISGFLLYCES